MNGRATPGLGGDRNVLFMREGQQIHRSSHALVDDLADFATDANSAEQLFEALKHEDCVVFAHIGGRYADIKMAHDARIERSVEVHSDWGTFEWLLHDALEQGYRVGILANSDGHKGRHGASHPGASLFGAYGGLSCLLAAGSDPRRAVRRAAPAPSLRDDRLPPGARRRGRRSTPRPSSTPTIRSSARPPARRSRTAMMGDILRSDDEAVEFNVEALASAPIERLEIRNGLDVLETWRPYDEAALGRRIRVIWEGSEYRGRGRQTIWDGGCALTGQRVRAHRADQFVEPRQEAAADRPGDADLGSADHRRLWRFRCLAGRSPFRHASDRHAAREMRDPDRRYRAAKIWLFEAGGIGRRIRVFRLPDEQSAPAAAIVPPHTAQERSATTPFMCV